MGAWQSTKGVAASFREADEGPPTFDDYILTLSTKERETLTTRRHQNQVKNLIDELKEKLDDIKKTGKRNPLSEDRVHRMLESKRTRNAELKGKDSHPTPIESSQEPSDNERSMTRIKWSVLNDKFSICLMDSLHVGKSIAVREYARDLGNTDKLGAAFFCSENRDSQGSITPTIITPTIITTLACQLADKYPAYKKRLFETIAQDPLILDLDFRTQFRKLITEPSILQFSHQSKKRLAIVIDGLDRCGTISEQVQILNIINDYVELSPSPVFTWLVFVHDAPHLRSSIRRFRCYRQLNLAIVLLLNIIGDNAKEKRLIDSLKDNDAKLMLDFLVNLFLDLDAGIQLWDRKRILYLLHGLSVSSRTEPSTFSLRFIENFNFSELSRDPQSGSSHGVVEEKDWGESVGLRRSDRQRAIAEFLDRTKDAIPSAQFQHEHLLPFYGVYDAKEAANIAIILPRMENVNLVEYLKNSPDTLRIPLVHDIISGLEYLHRLGIIHGDLNAKNVVVSGSGRAKLGDLGVWKEVVMVTRTIMLYAGKEQGKAIPHQMAPELLKKQGGLTGLEGDIWALGWTCCEIIGVPYPRGQLMSVVDVSKPQKPPEAIHWTEDKEKIWSQVVDLCCEPEASKRPMASQLLTKISELNSHDTRPPDLDPFSSATARAPTEIDMDCVERLLQSLLQTPQALSSAEERSAALETISDDAEPSSSSSPVAVPVSKPSPPRIVAAPAHSTVPDNPVSTVDRGATSGTSAYPEKASPSSSSPFASAPTSTDAPDPTYAKFPITRSFSDARSWIINAVQPSSAVDESRPDLEHLRRSLSALDVQDAQHMIDFLDELLKYESIEGNAWRRVFSLLYSTAKSVITVPRRLEILNVNYNFIAPCNEGGFGSIYKGEFSGRTVCVKSPRVHQGSDLRLLTKVIIGELIISAHTSHKNIVPFYGAYRYQDRPWAHVSAFMESGDLRMHLAQYPNTRRIPFIADIISGLNYLHEMDIIFADVKASNVLVSNDRRALLTDFGISRPVMADEERTSLGTPNWLAPEVLCGDDVPPSKASDIWSFACTCYEVLTGLAPFHSGPYAGGFHRLIAAMLSRKVIPELPDTLAVYDGTNDDELAKNMRELMLRCWNYEPAERPSASVIKTIISELRYVDNRRPSSLNAAGIGRQVMQSKVDIDYDRVLAVFSKISR